MSAELIGILSVGLALAALIMRQSSRLDGQIDGLETRIGGLDSRMGALEQRMARFEGLLEGLGFSNRVGAAAGD